MLAAATTRNLKLDVISYYVIVHMLMEFHRHYIHSRIKYISTMPFYCVSLKYIWNKYYIIVNYKFYTISVSKKSCFVCCSLTFLIIPVSYHYWWSIFLSWGKRAFNQVFGFVKFRIFFIV